MFDNIVQNNDMPIGYTDVEEYILSGQFLHNFSENSYNIELDSELFTVFIEDSFLYIVGHDSARSEKIQNTSTNAHFLLYASVVQQSKEGSVEDNIEYDIDITNTRVSVDITFTESLASITKRIDQTVTVK